MFKFVLTTLESEGGGIRGFQVVTHKCAEACRNNPDLAAPLLLIAQAADDFIEEHERMPLASSTVEQMQKRMKHMVETFETAWSSGADDAKLVALTDAARRIFEVRFEEGK